VLESELSALATLKALSTRPNIGQPLGARARYPRRWDLSTIASIEDGRELTAVIALALYGT
jgi:hypothetical protein